MLGILWIIFYSLDLEPALAKFPTQQAGKQHSYVTTHRGRRIDDAGAILRVQAEAGVKHDRRAVVQALCCQNGQHQRLLDILHRKSDIEFVFDMHAHHMIILSFDRVSDRLDYSYHTWFVTILRLSRLLIITYRGVVETVSLKPEIFPQSCCNKNLTDLT